MIETAKLAGFCAAHGIWSVSDGETLIPLVGYEEANGERGIVRYARDDVGDGARAAQDALEYNEEGWARAVLVADAYLHTDDGRRDAVIVEAVRYGLTPWSMKVAVPYVPRTARSDFAVFRPKFIEVAGFDDDSDHEPLANAFFAGVDAHPEGAAVWNAHLHPST
jgi:hypothetical protein